MLPAKRKNLYESWTLSAHYNKKYRNFGFPLMTINKKSKIKTLFVSKLYKKVKYRVQLQYHEIVRCRRLKFYRTRTWARWKRASRKFKKVRNNFHRYENVEVNRIVYNKARRSYFHPYYTYFFRKYIYYKFERVGTSALLEAEIYKKKNN